MALKYEKSCGALVFRQDPKTGCMYILMIRHKRGGHRSFPKGHVEAGETEHQTAIREVEEETRLLIPLHKPSASCITCEGNRARRERFRKESDP